MKNLLCIFLLASSFVSAQMPDISRVWLNENQWYTGSIGNQDTKLNLRITLSQQDRKNDQEYFVSGVTIVERNLANFEGKIKITKYKGGKKKSVVFGEYDFAEEPKGKHSGIFKGKFIHTFKWNKKTEKIESNFIQFTGDWTSYEGTLNLKTNWKNH